MKEQKTKMIENAQKQVIKAAFALAEEGDWHFVRLSDIATRAEMDMADLRCLIDDKNDILRLYAKHLDAEVIEAFAGQIIEGDSSKDRLFDIMMERFDLMNDHREALLSIMHAYRRDPKYALLNMPYIGKSMMWMLDLAEIDTDGLRGCAKILGMTVLYVDILVRVWTKDNSPDLVKTMAALDKALGRAEQAANSFGLS